MGKKMVLQSKAELPGTVSTVTPRNPDPEVAVLHVTKTLTVKIGDAAKDIELDLTGTRSPNSMSHGYVMLYDVAMSVEGKRIYADIRFRSSVPNDTKAKNNIEVAKFFAQRAEEKAKAAGLFRAKPRK